MTSHSNDQTAVMKSLFLLSVLLIYPLPQIAIDIYLPSWPAMVSALHTSRELLQWSLTIYVLFLGMAQLIYGPLSDRFGRKPVLLFGIGVFFISSFMGMFVVSMGQLLVLRAIQGLSIGCGFTVASAILADVFQGNQLAKVTSYSAMIYSISLMFAPFIGGYLQHYIGWQANFGGMALYALILFLLIYLFVFETKDKQKKAIFSISSILKNYFLLFHNLVFIGAIFCLILAYGVMITFNIVGPFLLQETLHVSVIGYGQLLLLIGVAYFIGATVNSFFVKYAGIHRLIILGLILMFCSSLGLVAIVILHVVTVTNIVALVGLTIFSVGFIYPNCFAYALDVFHEKGYASALIGSAILIGVSIISAIVSHFNIDHEYCLSFAFLILSILSILSYVLTRIIIKKR